MGLFNTTSATEDFGNTGLQNFPGNVGKHRILVAVPKGSEIATKTLADTIGTWIANFNNAKASRWFPLPPIVDGTPEQEDSVRQDFDFGYSSFVRDGKLTYTYILEEMTIYNKNELNKLSLGDFDFFIITDKEWILGYTEDGVILKPFQADYFNVLPESQNTGSENAHVSIQIKFTDVRQHNLMQVAVNPTKDSEAPTVWYPTLEFQGLKDLQITLVSLAATAGVLTIKGYDNVPYSAAVKEDLYLRKTTVDAAAISITSLTESGTIPGQYAFVVGAQTSGTYFTSLYNQPDATTLGVETPVVHSLAVTI